MLYISLVVSGLLLLAANGAARGSKQPVVPVACLGLAFTLGPACLGFGLPAVALQAIGLSVAVLLWRDSRRTPGSFLKPSLVATLIAYGLTGIMVVRTEHEYRRLRSLYPYESMEARVLVARTVPGGDVRLPATSSRLTQLEESVSDNSGGLRQYWLRSLHEESVELFINSAGFGVSRVGPPNGSNLARSLRDGWVLPQPGPRLLFEWSPGDLARLPAEDEEAMGLMLRDSIVDFVNPQNFGYFKDRRHVAGFQPHQFSKVPASPVRWKVRNVELVGLLLKDEPRAYVSAELPRMDRPRDVPTRPLDRFESFGLDSLRQEEDIVTARDGDGLRMLGSIRNARQCVDCHGGERGALLGAFSYILGPEKLHD